MATGATRRGAPRGGWDWRLWLGWVFAGALGNALAAPLWWLEERIYRAIHNLSIYGAPLAFSDLFVALGLTGGAIALGQWAALRARLPLRAWTIAPWVVGGLVLGFCPVANFADTGDIAAQAIDAGVVAGIVGLVAGAVQAIALSGYVPWAGRWVIVSAVGCGVGWALDVYVEGTALVRYVGAYNAGVAGYAVSAALIGAALVWLMRKSRPPYTTHGSLPA